VVVLTAGRGGNPVEELVEYCKNRLASYKCPKRIAVVPVLPRNAMGKIQKNQIIEQLTEKTGERSPY
jgi:acyl-CoA synthetase (AMP-forming)/AMP-acid ligase II